MNKIEIRSCKTIIYLCRLISWIFTPFAIPVLAFVLLLSFSYMRMLPTSYRIHILLAVVMFTILIPLLAIRLFHSILKLTKRQQNQRKYRYFPLLFTLIGYLSCWYFLSRISMAWFICAILGAASVSLSLCFVANLKLKVSEHMTGAGIVVGGIVVFSLLLGINAILWLCIALLISGLLGSARVILKHHTVIEVLAGFLIGIISVVAVTDIYCGGILYNLLF